MKKILLSVSCSNEYNDSAPTYALLDVDADTILRFLALLERSKHCKEADNSFAKAVYWGAPCCWIRYDDEIEALPDKIQQDLHDGLPVVMPDGFTLSDEALAKTECDQLVVWPDEILFTAISKHTNDRVETGGLSEPFLRSHLAPAGALQ
jgi:hypothetical protein